MMGGPYKESWGFTIVETMIVLAVSGVILFSVLGLVSGRQNKTQFDVAIRQTQQLMQETINNVASGYYPNNNTSFRCEVTSGIKTPPRIYNGAVQQGANNGCILLGKAIQFAPSGASDQIYAITLAGNAKNTSGGDAVSLDEAQPVAIYPGSSSTSSQATSYTATTLQFGLRVTRAYWTSTNTANTAQNDLGAIGLVTSFPGTDDYGTASGSNGVNLYAITGTTINQSTTALVDRINSSATAGGENFQRIGSANICFASQGSNESGLITIGGTGGQSNVTLKIMAGQTC